MGVLSPPRIGGDGLLASAIQRPIMLSHVCMWFYNSALNVTFAVGRWLIQGYLLKFDWDYPMSQGPIVLGCVSL